MKEVIVGNQQLEIKDYYCSYEGEYIPRTDGKLWLYVNIADVCNGSCPFCINPCSSSGENHFDICTFRETLRRISAIIYGVSLTGGEPMLCPELANSVICAVGEVLEPSVEVDMVTNGTGFSTIIESLPLNKLDSVHLSRHEIEDAENATIFGFPTAPSKQISQTLQKIKDPAQIVLNCALISGHIDSREKVAEYLEFASELGIKNVSFIGLSKCNKYCVEHYVDPKLLEMESDKRFHIWNAYRDHEYCSCSSGSYDARNGSIRFYYRRIGERNAPYIRQLVYTADNRLLAGFSGKEIVFD